MIVYPSYYTEFRCIASRCRHNCCIGWEIDVDDETADRYRRVDGELGKRLKENICYNDTSAFFRLAERDRCPFLNGQNLCDIIGSLGEDALCEICREHPRYRNFYSQREEVGLGLSCEEAARIVLSQAEPMRLVNTDGIPPEDLGDGEEQQFFRHRREVLAGLQDRTCSLAARMDRLSECLGISLDARSLDEWISVFRSLECLDPAWHTALSSITPEDWNMADERLDLPGEQLISAFVYRHFSRVLEGDSPAALVGFCILSTRTILALWHARERENGTLTTADLVEYTRMYSAEIEYSPENTDRLIDEFYE